MKALILRKNKSIITTHLLQINIQPKNVQWITLLVFLCALALAVLYVSQNSTLRGDLTGTVHDETQSTPGLRISTVLSGNRISVIDHGAIIEQERTDDARVTDYDNVELMPSDPQQEALGVIVKVRSECVPLSNRSDEMYGAFAEDQVQNLEDIVRKALPEVAGAPPSIESIFAPPAPLFPRTSSSAYSEEVLSTVSATTRVPAYLEKKASTDAGLNRIVSIDLRTVASTQAALDALQPNPCIEYAVPNATMKIASYPNDPFFSTNNSWSQGYDDLWGLKKIETQGAWSAGASGTGIVVAVIDTGVTMNHPDLAANLWTNLGEIPGNGIDDDANGYIDDIHGWNFVSDNGNPEDDHGHGTHVAGTIAAVANNGIGIAGIAPNAKIMVVKGLDNTGNGRLDYLAAGVQYAARNGAKVLNNSWGAPIGQNPLLNDVFAYAEQLGAISIAAAGNSDTDAAGFSPANVETMITVAASTPQDTRASFSNYGDTVDIAAPGGDNFTGDGKHNILSTMSDVVTIANERPTLKVSDGYWRLAGTSMASPHVAGVAALLLSKRPNLTQLQVRGILQATADPFNSETAKPINGGRINAQEAVAFEGLPPIVELQIQTVLSGSIVFRGTAMGNNFASYDITIVDGAAETTLIHGTSPITNDVFGTWDSWKKDDGIYKFRLTVRTTDDVEISVTKQARIRNVSIFQPYMNDTFRLGDTVPVTGSVRGAIDHFTVEYGVGWNASVWQTDGITLTDNGQQEIYEPGLIANWDTASITDGGLYSLRLRVVRPDGTEVIETLPHIMLDPMIRAGWPNHSYAYSLIGGRFETRTADLDGDGVQEIIFTTLGKPLQSGGELFEPPTVSVVRPDGTLIWQRSMVAADERFSFPITPVILDIDGDGKQEIAISRGGSCTNNTLLPCELLVFRHDGTDQPGWSKMFDAETLGVVLNMYAADTDHDGAMEIITQSNTKNIAVIDASGNIRHQFTIPIWNCSYLNFQEWNQSIAIAELDGDPEPELVLHGDCNRITAKNLDGSTVPGWPFQPDGLPTYMSPVAVDIDNDGIDEISVGVKTPMTNDKVLVQLFLLDAHASPLPGWPVDLYQGTDRNVSTEVSNGVFPPPYGTPAIGDVTGDTVPEIFVPGTKYAIDACKIYGFRADGTILPGWPVVTSESYPCDDFEGLFPTGVAIADVNGDRKNDVIFGGSGDNYYAIKYGETERNGGIRAWNGDGSAIDLNGELPGSALLAGSPCAAGLCFVAARDVPIVTDLDGNGTTEIIFAEWLSQAFGRGLKEWNSLTIWDLPSAYHAPRAPWPTRYHDGELSSRYTTPTTCGEGNVEPDKGEQCDDDNNAKGDGCSALCRVETDFFCAKRQEGPFGVGNPESVCWTCGTDADMTAPRQIASGPKAVFSIDFAHGDSHTTLPGGSLSIIRTSDDPSMSHGATLNNALGSNVPALIYQFTEGNAAAEMNARARADNGEPLTFSELFSGRFIVTTSTSPTIQAFKAAHPDIVFHESDDVTIDRNARYVMLPASDLTLRVRSVLCQ